MSHTILWVQNESPNLPSTILINEEEASGEAAQTAFNELCRANQNLVLSEDLREKLQRKLQQDNRYFSHQANYVILPNHQGVYLQGCYLNKDDAGRRMPYMFLCQGTNSVKFAFEKLRESSAKVNRTCNEDELRTILLVSRKTLRKKFGIILLVIITIVLWIILSPKN